MNLLKSKNFINKIDPQGSLQSAQNAYFFDGTKMDRDIHEKRSKFSCFMKSVQNRVFFVNISVRFGAIEKISILRLTKVSLADLF